MKAHRWMTLKMAGSVLVVIAVAAGAGVFLYPGMFETYTGLENAPLTFASSRTLNDREFEAAAAKLTESLRLQKAREQTADEKNAFARRVKVNMLINTRSFIERTAYPHIGYFRDAGIRRYEGPKTCLQCHPSIHVSGADGKTHQVDTLDSVVDTVHFKFQSSATGFTTYGYDGRQVNAEGERHIPVGKINRACGVPGSFTWTGWATLVNSKPAAAQGKVEVRSEGCGQCHIGGNYQPATEKMMPIGDVPDSAKQGIDCLICHSGTYDMNQRYVIKDANGMRWNQDRSLQSALTVGLPNNDNCLFCHQHNLGGDSEFNGVAANSANQHLGYRNKRLLHYGAKRGSSFTPKTDVHAAAGIRCTDCHVPEGHGIPRGNKGVDLVATDLPGKTVACENCHTQAPHVKSKNRVILNGHIARLACETCHIKELRDDSVVLRDWVHPVWNPDEGVYTYADVYKSGKPGKGFKFLWLNGSGTFLANALGDNPLGGGRYNPLMNQMVTIDDPQAVAAIRAYARRLQSDYPDIDVESYVKAATDPLSQLSPQIIAQRRAMIERNLRPAMKRGKSRIYPFKIFNAMMFEDMSNQGPFGAMILPFDYASYYEKGKPLEAMKTAIRNPIVKRMYETPFKYYMMDEFMHYFGVKEWSGRYPLLANGKLRNVEPHWMRQMGTLMVNHGIQKKGRECKDCHAEKGIMPFAELGYPPERVKDLLNLPELRDQKGEKVASSAP